MDREKQIKEIATILLETSRQDSNDKSKNKAYTEFHTDTIFKYGCDRLNGATAIYDAGYRKQSEVAMEIIGEILLNHTPDIDGFFIMHETELAELKKKYIGE